MSWGQFCFATIVALKEAVYFVNLLLATCISSGYLLLAPFSEENKMVKLDYLLSPESIVMGSLADSRAGSVDCACDRLLWSWNDVPLVGSRLPAVGSVAHRCPCSVVRLGCEERIRVRVGYPVPPLSEKGGNGISFFAHSICVNWTIYVMHMP